MSNAVTNICRRLRMPPTRKAVLMCLADFCHDDGKDWHSIAAMVEWTCLSKRTVIDALKGLEDAGLIVIERTKGARSTTFLQLQRIAELTANQCASRTSAGGAPVQEPHDTSAPAAPPPVQEPHKPVQEPHPNHSEPSVNHQETPERERRRKGKAAAHPLPDGFDVSPRVEAWAQEHGHTRLPEHLEAFRLKCQAKGYEYADWDAAFMGAIKSDWAGLGPYAARPRGRKSDALMAGNVAAAQRFLRGFESKNYSEGISDDGQVA